MRTTFQMASESSLHPSYLGFDPDVFVDVNFFGEDDTRSFMLRMSTERFTKIINVPNMKDHRRLGRGPGGARPRAATCAGGGI